ncbi:MAG: hypothetical protein JXO49_07690 [Deltaproteobacteria bacterium]|nr:hypothetical protein [Candidatus Anaeroferrophillus wilburensis]MBN2889210.1 hypothetical protein [Deltaproteobacteria bacterium]
MRQEAGPLLVVNAGNLLFRREEVKPEKMVEAQLTADLIVASYNTMGCDAFNVGAYDLSLGIDYLMQKKAKAQFPFLSANLCDRHGKLLFQPSLMKTVQGVKVAIFGLLSDDVKLDKVAGGNKIMVKDPYAVATELVPALKKAGADYVILLTDMVGRDCRRLAQQDLPINLIVGSSRKNQISLPININQTYITHLDRGGKSVGLLEVKFLDAQGLMALPVAERMKGSEVGRCFYLNKFFQLRLSIPDHPVIAPKVVALAEKIKRLQQVKATQSMTIPGKKSMGVDGGNQYVGVEVCAKCHQDRYALWQASEHSRAYQALVKKNQQFDADCIACHSLAYEREGGFTDMKHIGFYTNVQCESCHGPGHLHVSSDGDPKKIVKERNEAICLQCHISEKSPDFDFETYQIKVCGGAK